MSAPPESKIKPIERDYFPLVPMYETGQNVEEFFMSEDRAAVEAHFLALCIYGRKAQIRMRCTYGLSIIAESLSMRPVWW